MPARRISSCWGCKVIKGWLVALLSGGLLGGVVCFFTPLRQLGSGVWLLIFVSFFGLGFSIYAWKSKGGPRQIWGLLSVVSVVPLLLGVSNYLIWRSVIFSRELYNQLPPDYAEPITVAELRARLSGLLIGLAAMLLLWGAIAVAQRSAARAAVAQD